MSVAVRARADGHSARRAWPWRVALGVLVLVGIGFRMWSLGAQRLGFDEAFTAMAGRRSVGGLLGYLRVRDSHPPLDYLLRMPLGRAGASEFLVRLPSVIVSIGALVLVAWWMRARGLAGAVATGLVAVSAFQLVHGREARMYAELELIGVAVAMLADAWLRRPRSWHGPALGVLVAIGLLTHVSMFLLVFGLLIVPGLRTDRDAWRWRLGLGAGTLVWAALWGPSFVVQSGGGHSSWIPPTTVARFVDAVGGLLAPRPGLHLVGLIAVAIGTVLVARRDRRLGRVMLSCFVVPVGFAAVAGLFAPVMLDRTLTLFSWAPWLAVGYLVAAVVDRSRLVGFGAVAVLAWVMIPMAVAAVRAPSNIDLAIRHLEAVTRPGDVVASDPGLRLHLLSWSLGVRRELPVRPMTVRQYVGTPRGVLLGNDAPTGRVWVLTSVPRRTPGAGPTRCAPDWSRGAMRVSCVQEDQVRTDHEPPGRSTSRSNRLEVGRRQRAP